MIQKIPRNARIKESFILQSVLTPKKTNVLTDRDHHDIVQRPSLPRHWGLS